jgi:hypothetical protein
MTEAIKVLGQSKPAATTLTDLYAVPADNFAVVSTVTACEQSGTATTFRLAVAVAGASTNPKQYIVYDAALEANETKAFTLGITLAATDVLRVYSASGSVAFNAFGAETAP